MPNFDKTGPNGQGPKTGRSLGICNGNKSQSRSTGRCFERGGRRGFFKAENTPDSEEKKN